MKNLKEEIHAAGWCKNPNDDREWYSSSKIGKTVARPFKVFVTTDLIAIVVPLYGDFNTFHTVLVFDNCKMFFDYIERNGVDYSEEVYNGPEN